MKNKEPRDQYFQLRLSSEEKMKLEKNAVEAGMTISEYIRGTSVNSSKHLTNPKELFATIRTFASAVNKVGNNINQVTNYLNYIKLKNQYDPEEVKKFNELLAVYIRLEENLFKEFRLIKKKL